MELDFQPYLPWCCIDELDASLVGSQHHAIVCSRLGPTACTGRHLRRQEALDDWAFGCAQKRRRYIAEAKRLSRQARYMPVCIKRRAFIRFDNETQSQVPYPELNTKVRYYNHKLGSAMLSKVFLVAIMAASTTLAASPYSWNVHSFNGTCSTTACWAWGFSISGAVGPADQPAFEASGCGVDSRITEPQPCSNMEMDSTGSVAVQIEVASQFGGLLTVQYTFRQYVTRS